MSNHPGMFADMLTRTLNDILKQKFVGQPVSNQTYHDIKHEIKTLLTNTFAKSTTHLDSISIEWLTTTYFKSAFIDAGQAGQALMGDQIVSNDVEPADLPFIDVRILSTLFRNTDIGDKLLEELNRRKNMS